MKKNIFITGAGGFAGRNLTEYLSSKYKEKYNIISKNHKELDLLNEVEVENFFRSNKIDVVLHCANVGGSRTTNYDISSNDIVKNNLKMFFNIERCLTPEMKMIHFGSGAQYDKSRDLIKISEKEFGLKVPEDTYGFSKYVMSKYIANTKNIICLCIFGLYGKYEDYTFKFISNAILKNLLNMPIVINQNVIFDFLYIDDFLKIVDRCIEEESKDKLINIVPTESIDLISLAKLINKVSNFKSEIIVLNEGLNIQYTAENEVLLRNMKNFKFTSYEQGVKDLYKYYELVLPKIDIEIIKNDPYLKYCKIK